MSLYTFHWCAQASYLNEIKPLGNDVLFGHTHKIILET